MKKLKLLFAGVVLGLLLGLWFGFNLGKGKPFYSNPFEDEEVQQEIQSKIDKGRDVVGENVEKIGEDIKGN